MIVSIAAIWHTSRSASTIILMIASIIASIMTTIIESIIAFIIPAITASKIARIIAFIIAWSSHRSLWSRPESHRSSHRSLHRLLHWSLHRLSHAHVHDIIHYRIDHRNDPCINDRRSQHLGSRHPTSRLSLMVKNTATMLKRLRFKWKTLPRQYLRANATSKFDLDLNSTLSEIDYNIELLVVHWWSRIPPSCSNVYISTRKHGLGSTNARMRHQNLTST